MSNWAYLNSNRITAGPFGSSDEEGFNGMFHLIVTERKVPVQIIASDGMGWQHVSVSQCGSNKPPTWDVMCAVKDLFWEAEDWVVQYHPAKSAYVNNHSGVLHMWRPLKEILPMPDSIMVGIKELGELV